MSVLKLKIDEGNAILNPNEILYVEAANKHSVIHFTNLEELKSRNPLKLIELKLKEPIFFRIHDSYIINCSFLKSINNHHVILLGDKIVPLSRYKKKLLELNMEYYYILKETRENLLK